MTELRVDSEQLELVLDALKPSKQRGWNLDSWLKFLRLVAILVAGLWALWIYLAHQREALTLENKSKALGNEAKALDNESARQSRMETGLSVKTRRLSSAEDFYEVTVGVDFTNKSKKRVEVSFTAVEYFLGTFRANLHRESFIRINPPPMPGEDQIVGAVNWKRIGGYSHVISGGPERSFPALDGFKETPLFGGGGTSQLDATEEGGFMHKNFIEAPEGSLIGIAVTIGLDGGEAKGNVVYRRYWGPFATKDGELEKSGSTRSGGS